MSMRRIGTRGGHPWRPWADPPRPPSTPRFLNLASLGSSPSDVQSAIVSVCRPPYRSLGSRTTGPACPLRRSGPHRSGPGRPGRALGQGRARQSGNRTKSAQLEEDATPNPPACPRPEAAARLVSLRRAALESAMAQAVLCRTAAPRQRLRHPSLECRYESRRHRTSRCRPESGSTSSPCSSHHAPHAISPRNRPERGDRRS
jgi:hypothetical protein